MAENGYAPSLSPDSKNESLGYAPMTFTTLSGGSPMVGGARKGYMSLANVNNTNTNNGRLEPIPPPAQPTSGEGCHILLCESTEDLTPPPSKRPRGRPPGTKNKPKPPVFIREDNETLMKPILIEIPVGNDIVQTLINLAVRRHASILVLSGSGLVSDVTLHHPVSRSPAFPIQGPLNMLSLSGTYVNANSGRVPPQSIINPPSCSSFSINLSGARWQVFGGIIGGKVMSAGPVIVTAALFRKPEFHRVAFVNGSVEEAEEHDPRYVGGVIINDDRATAEPNNTAAISSFGVVGASSTPPNHNLALPPADVNFMQWNHSTRTNNY